MANITSQSLISKDMVHLCACLFLFIICAQTETIARLDMTASEVAWKFSSKWMDGKQIYLRVILPTIEKFKYKDAMSCRSEVQILM